MSRLNDRQIAAIWVWAGPLLFFFTIGTFFQTRSPGAGAFPGAPTIPAGNAETAAYWGAVVGAAGVAMLTWLAATRVRHFSATIWWRRLPLAPLEREKERSAILSIGALCAFVAVPTVAVVSMAIRSLQAAIVAWPTGEVVAQNFWRRAELFNANCNWGFNQCFRVGNTEGIEYKPIITDGILIITVLAVVWQIWSLIISFRNKQKTSI